MSFYEDIAASVNQLITEFGTPVVLERTSGSSFDPVSGSNVGETTQTLNSVAIAGRLTEAWKDELGANVKTGDSMLTLDPAVKPLHGDKVTINGKVMTLVEVVEVNPAGTPIYYIALVRQ